MTADSWMTRCTNGHTVRWDAERLQAAREQSRRILSPWICCPMCGAVTSQPKLIRGYASAKPCDARCTGARGVDCECSCVGANHGTDYRIAS